MNWFAKKTISPETTTNKLAETLYVRAVERIREPRFYNDCAIEDSPLGRFELLSLHLFILLRLLKEHGSPEASQVSQALCDLFAADMDHSLRDIRLSEMKADRQYKKFIEGFYGRLVSYDEAIDFLPERGATERDLTKLVEAILKNVYSGNSSNGSSAEGLATYVMGQLSAYRQNGPQQDLLNIKFT